MIEEYPSEKFKEEAEETRKALRSRYNAGLIRALGVYLLIAIFMAVFSSLSDHWLKVNYEFFNDLLKALFSSLSNAAAIFTGAIVITYYKEGVRARLVYDDFVQYEPLPAKIGAAIEDYVKKTKLTPSARRAVTEAAQTCAARALGEKRDYGGDFQFHVQELREVLEL